MSDRAKKITELTSITNTTSDDLLLIVNNPSNSSLAQTMSITVGDLFGKGIGANTANTAYANAVVFANTIANTAYANAVIFANTIANTAYANAIAYANTAAATAYTNSVTYTITAITGADVFISNSHVLRANTVQILRTESPANSTVLTINKGVLFYDADYLYIATEDNLVKRVALNSFE